MAENQPLRADGRVIEANIRRIFGTFKAATKKTGISRTGIWLMIQNGEISDASAGKLYKVGVDPAELVRPIEEKRA